MTDYMTYICFEAARPLLSVTICRDKVVLVMVTDGHDVLASRPIVILISRSEGVLIISFTGCPLAEGVTHLIFIHDDAVRKDVQLVLSIAPVNHLVSMKNLTSPFFVPNLL